MAEPLPTDDGPIDLYQALQHSMQRAFFGMVLAVCLLGAVAMPLLATRLGLPIRVAMLVGYGAVAATAWRALRLPAARSAGALPPLVLIGMAVVAVVAASSGWGLQTPGLLFFGMAVCMVHALGPGAVPLLTTGLALAVVAGLGGAEMAGWLPQPAPAASLAQRLVLHCAVILAGAVVGHAVASALREHAQAATGRESRFRGLLGMATSAYWETDAELRLTVATWRNRRGDFVPMQHAVGARPWQLTNVGLDAEAAGHLQQAMQTRQPLRDLPTWWERNGVVSHFMLNAEPRLSASGKFRGYWGVARDVTAEQHARAAQASSEARYRELFDILPSALTLHQHGVVVDANRAAAQLLGYATVADMIGVQLLEAHVAEADRSQVQARLQAAEALQPGEAVPSALLQMHDTAGRAFTVSSVGVRADHAGAPAVLTIGNDETARLEAASALARTQTLLSTVVAMSPDVIALTSMPDGRYVMVNSSFTRVLGYASGDVVGRTALELGLWRDPAQRVQLAQALAAQGPLPDTLVEMVAKDGRTVPLMVAATQLQVDGETYTLTNARDLTETTRVQLEREAILGNASVGIAFTRTQRFEMANAQFEQMLGWAPGGLVGQPGRSVFPSDADYATLSAAVGPALGRGDAVDTECLLARRDGSTFQARLRAKAIDPRQPANSGTIWIAEDVTDARLAEQALARAVGAAEAASRAKSDFLANTSHEIRTPLNGLTGLARLARQPGLPPERLRQYLAQIDDSAQLLSTILSDILDVAKIEAGKLQLEQAPFDLPALLRSLQQAYGALAEHQGLAFDAEIDPALPPMVLGDALRVRQVLSNFLHNALKFTQQGRVRLVARALAGDQVRFEVHDTGQGLDGATQARLFKPFTQADESTTRRFGGTGLGLSICRELATLMGGSVGVHSQPGQGSCFHAELPLPPAAGSARPDAEASPDARLRGARVLLVEDNAVNMMVGEALLDEWGVRVTPAIDGALALAAVARAAAEGWMFDAVLMDVQMPGMSGYETTEALRRQHSADALPVIALTAGALVSERERALAHGMTDFLTKPIDPLRLQAALLRALAGRSPPPTGAGTGAGGDADRSAVSPA
jgi:PAS domain S-box-containing protein